MAELNPKVWSVKVATRYKEPLNFLWWYNSSCLAEPLARLVFLVLLPKPFFYLWYPQPSALTRMSHILLVTVHTYASKNLATHSSYFGTICRSLGQDWNVPNDTVFVVKISLDVFHNSDPYGFCSILLCPVYIYFFTIEQLIEDVKFLMTISMW